MLIIPLRSLSQSVHGKECQQQQKLTAPAQDFDNFSTSGVLPKRLQCDCRKAFKSDYCFQIHIDGCDYTESGFRSS